MSSNPLVLTPIEGEPRVHDLLLAERLGFERPRAIRQIIKRNEAKLLKLGGCHTVERLVEGNLTNEFYLNQKQAIFICMKSETEQAFDVQIEIVRVFDAYLSGDFTLSPPNPAFRPEKTRKALPGGLTIEQQDAVKALVKCRVETLPHDAQAKGAITCWSAIKSKFGVTYKEVPAANFAEVLSLVARLALPHEPQALPPIHFPAVTAMPKWDPNHMNSYGQLCLSAKNTFFNPDWADPEWLLLKLLQERGIDVNGPLISYQLKMNLIRFYEMELPDFLTNIIPSLIRGKGMFWDENWAPRH